MISFYEYHKNLISGHTSQQLDFPLHMHGGPELLRVRSGYLKVWVLDREYDVKAGNMIVIFPNISHSYQTISAEEDTFIDLIICKHDTNNGFPTSLIGCNITNPIQPITQLHPDVDYLFSSLLTEINSCNEKQNSTLISTILQLFWLRLLPQLDIVPGSMLTSANHLSTAVISYISQHFTEPLSLDIISKELGICRYYLSRIFTQVLHTGFHEYVNTLRIDYAKKLLLNTQDSILDIAIQCGYQNQQTFNRVFKNLCGVSPSIYRKNTLYHSL